MVGPLYHPLKLKYRVTMPSLSNLPRPFLKGIAILYALATLAYSGLWMYYIRRLPPVTIGISYHKYEPSQGALRLMGVAKNSVAERAGLQRGDRIVAINGRPLHSFDPYVEEILLGQPGEVVRFTVERAGAGAPLSIEMTLPPPPKVMGDETWYHATALQVIGSFPLVFVVVGLIVLFLRLEDRNAWLLALLFGAFAAMPEPGNLEAEAAMHPSIRGALLCYHYTLGWLAPALFAYFFAIFPAPSPLDRRLPWLKHAVLAVGAALAVALGTVVLMAGSREPVVAFAAWLDERASFLGVMFAYTFGGLLLGLVSLTWNRFRAPSTDVRRKIRVITWGAIAGLIPVMLLSIVGLITNTNPYEESPFWIWVSSIAALFFLPISFAYSVVKHRVLDVPVLLKRSARYVLVRQGFVLFTVLASAAVVLVFAEAFAYLFRQWQQMAVAAGVTAGAAFGLLLAWGGAQVQRNVIQRIDRSFFRSAYDARQVLQELSVKIRTADTREALAELLEDHVTEALHPSSLHIYLETAKGLLRSQGRQPPTGLELVPADLPVLVDLAERGQPWELPDRDALDMGSAGPLADLKPECLAPMLGRDGRLAGLIVLGPRLSEEPYSGEDRSLLASVASQAALAIESIRLAEEIAERLEAERRSIHEMELARQVQARLFPQRIPRLETLECVGRCIQARAVGGDYYDFLEAASGRVALVLGDVSGKGMAAALLMASLQASLRGQYAAGSRPLPELLASANRLLYESTSPNHFCTLFFGDYNDANQVLRHVNCGHNPPVLLRAGGDIERLEATATVLGAFPYWECSVTETPLSTGDTLVIFTDGVTEAMNEAGEEFGEKHLIETLKASRHLSIEDLLETLISTVKQFSGPEQSDDLTLVLARVGRFSKTAAGLQAGNTAM